MDGAARDLRRRARAPLAAAALALVLIVGLVGCTSEPAPRPSASAGPASSPTSAGPSGTTSTPARTPAPTPVAVGSTTAATGAARCPLLDRARAQDTLGMRLARITVLRAGGRLVGCRIYALQKSPLHTSEHLPGPRQPAVEVRRTRYRSAADAHNALALLADRGQDPQQHDFGGATRGVCFRAAFDPADRGRDWACGFALARDLVLVRTVVTSPALNAVLVTRVVRRAV